MSYFDSSSRSVLLIILLSLLTACSNGVKFTYNQLDIIIPWYLDDYVELSDEQEILFDQRLAQQLRWHRSSQLPVYAQALRTINEDFENNLSLEKLYHHLDQFKQSWQTLIRQVTPDMAVILAEFSDQQVEQLFSAITEKNQQHKEKNVDVSEREWREKRAQRMLKNLERWLGDVSIQQKRLVNDWSQRLLPTAKMTQNYRQQRQQHLLQLLQSRQTGGPAFVQALQDLLINPQQLQPLELRRAREHNMKLVFELMLQLRTQLSSAQRLFFSDKITSLAEDFELLAQADE